MGMRTVLICHDGAALTQEGLARWLASFSDLVGIVVIREGGGRFWKRLEYERKRVGWLRLLDVLAFRIFDRLFLSAQNERFEREALEALRRRYPPVPEDVPVLYTKSPNSKATREFLEKLEPDVVLARCKVILKKRIFSIPTRGTFVMHPGICPEYRNSHGCFWALAQDDLDKVGMTLLKIDEGVDTGPVYGYYSYDYDALRETHTIIQHRVVLENLDAVAEKFGEIYRGEAQPIDTSGRPSGVWGQPWLSAYLRLKARARRRARGRA